jgi:hypothetical protein
MGFEAMQRKQVPQPSGESFWEYWPEIETESNLTSVERDLLAVVLSKEILNQPNLIHQLATIRCKYREYSNYGAFVHYEHPSPAPRVSLPLGPLGHATIGWNRSPLAKHENYFLMAWAFFKEGHLVTMELVPVGEDPWSAEECDALLEAAPAEVWIHH